LLGDGGDGGAAAAYSTAAARDLEDNTQLPRHTDTATAAEKEKEKEKAKRERDAPGKHPHSPHSNLLQFSVFFVFAKSDLLMLTLAIRKRVSEE
jgi:hypothetical protein